MQLNRLEPQIYSQIGIAGTTYEAGLISLIDLIKNANGICVDIGCGTGRVTDLIRKSAPNISQILGLDISYDMVRFAADNNVDPSIRFGLIDSNLPIQTDAVDLAVSAHVLEEMNTKESIIKLFSEIYRTLKLGGQFIILTANPEAMRNQAQFKTYQYFSEKEFLDDGDKITCTISGDDKMIIEDKFWSHAFIKRALIEAGFKIDSVFAPQPKRTNINNWRDELLIAPDSMWICYK